MIKEYIKIDVDSLIPYENNPRKNDSAVPYVEESISQVGYINPIIIDENNVILAGHTRLKALKNDDIKEVDVIKVSGLTDDLKRKYRLLDNKTGEFAEWDFDKLEEELSNLDFGDFDFNFDMPSDDNEKDKSAHDDDFVPDEDIQETTSKEGDIWQLGNHRLICGDSTNMEIVERLMCGEKANMVFTDPPYNIASDSKNYASDVSKAMKDLSESEWDKNFDIHKVLENISNILAEDTTVYICTSHFIAADIWAWMKKWASHYSYCVWSKPNPMPSLSKRHWTWNTELICYATRGKHTFNFPKEGHALSTWTINKKNGETGHPTEKPVEVPAMGISHSSKESDIVLDLFGGSGSTLMACEQLNRKCYTAEIDPHYCDVIIQRWEKFTGNKANKIG